MHTALKLDFAFHSSRCIRDMDNLTAEIANNPAFVSCHGVPFQFYKQTRDMPRYYPSVNDHFHHLIFFHYTSPSHHHILLNFPAPTANTGPTFL